MGNVIDFNKKQEVKEPAVLSTAYYMSVEIDGKEHKIEITGDELFYTTCPTCKCEVLLGFDTFIDIMQDGGLYGTMVLCEACATKRENLRGDK